MRIGGNKATKKLVEFRKDTRVGPMFYEGVIGRSAFTSATPNAPLRHWGQQNTKVKRVSLERVSSSNFELFKELKNALALDWLSYSALQYCLVPGLCQILFHSWDSYVTKSAPAINIQRKIPGMFPLEIFLATINYSRLNLSNGSKLN